MPFTSGTRAVPGAAMTVHASHRILARGAAPDDVMDEVRVAAHAVLLQRPRVARGDHDGLVKVHEREALGVPIAVVGLRDVLRDEIVRQVAIDAPGGDMVRAAAPGRVLLVHDVAVLAGSRVGGEVAETFAVAERERSETGESSSQSGRDDGEPSEREHGTHYNATRKVDSSRDSRYPRASTIKSVRSS